MLYHIIAKVGFSKYLPKPAKILLLSERSEVSEKEKKRGGEKRKEKRKKKEKGGEERRERRGREIGDFLTILNIFL